MEVSNKYKKKCYNCDGDGISNRSNNECKQCCGRGYVIFSGPGGRNTTIKPKTKNDNYSWYHNGEVVGRTQFHQSLRKCLTI